MSVTVTSEPTGAALVVGGGIAGMQASLDLAESGIKVYLVEKSSAIGGRMAQLDKTFPTNDCAMCTISPKLSETGRHPNIELLTSAEVVSLEGEPGHFTATVRQRPRFIDIAKCTGCGDCLVVCPVHVPSEFDHGLSQRTAVFRQYAQAVPGAFAIEKRGVSPCRDACPAGQRAQGYVALIRERRFADALRAIREENPFPGVCGRICNHRCEDSCSRAKFDSAVAICELKRFVSDRVYAETAAPAPGEKALVTRTERVAIVGSGPAGLTAAHDLAKLGYGVTVFEALPVAGGMMRVGVPEFRLPREVLDREIAEILALGVDIRTNTRVSDVSALLATDFQAVFLAAGAHRARKLPIPNADHADTLVATDFLRAVSLGESVPQVTSGRRVLVLGGGNVAVDTARTARHLGAEVSLACLESAEKMPASKDEIAEAKAEGIGVNPARSFTRIVLDGDKISGVECVDVIKMSFEEGRLSLETKPGSEHIIACDVVIFAIGQAPDVGFLQPGRAPEGVALTRRGLVAVDPETLQTGNPAVFAGGDVVTGTTWVIEAIAAGHKAARSIYRHLNGQPLVDAADAKMAAVELSPEEAEARVREGRASRKARAAYSAESPLDEALAVAEAERCLSCGDCSECLECQYACKREAVNHADRGRELPIEVGAVVVSAGFTPADARQLPEYGFGRYKNVLSAPQFERLLSASGPTTGHVVRPSDQQAPKKIAFLQCVGSRDQKHAYCSSVCCMYATKEALLALDHVPGVEIRIFQMDLRAFGKGFEAYYRRAEAAGVVYQRCRVATVKEIPDSRNLLVRHQTEDGKLHDEEFDLVVLSVGLEANADSAGLATRLGIELGPEGFARTLPGHPVSTTRPGVFVCGSFKEPKDIPDAVSEASAAASAALGLIAQSRGRLVIPKTYPAERNVDGEAPRIGVFVCHCGSNIASVVDVADVSQYALGLPNVYVAEHNLYTCSADTLKRIQEQVAEHHLNRVIVSSCTPRTHEPLFQETLREAGLNPYLFEMANIRDQCSWVHSKDHAAATAKARDLVRMAVARAATLESLHKEALGLSHETLVIGGGVAGMSAALALADQGYQVCLVEREKELGGGALAVDPKGVARDLRARVLADPFIEVLTETIVAKSTGFIGNFKTTLASANAPRQRLIEHGATVVATGGREYRGPEHRLGELAGVVTQGDLTLSLNISPASLRSAKSVVMIQCVGPWDKGLFYCSRLCCAGALENALRLKEADPHRAVYVLMKEMRAYGFKEELYTEARRRGVIFIRYTDANPPEVRSVDGRIVVAVDEPVLGDRLEIRADLVVLTEAIVPAEGARALADALKLPLTAEGFFLEAHPKLRPVDFASEGIFLCGAAHYPKTVEEAIAQGLAAAGRAATILSKDELMVGGVVAEVNADRCAACLTCVRVCPFEVPRIGAKETAEIEVARCQGCGICAAECPNDAIQLRHYRDDQVLVKTAALLGSR